MVNDDARASNARECLDACNAEDQCNYWDYGSSNPNWAKHCRLRSDDGGGPEYSVGYSFGSKNCVLEGIY